MAVKTVAIVAYGLMAIVAFGHAAENTDSCMFVGTKDAGCAASLGLLAGAFWPLYGSWYAFGAARDKERQP